jgi:predicted DCC family thiol-disulfide oxidoreductase YuxK
MENSILQGYPRFMPTFRVPILFYDGHCGLCDRFVRWTIQRDRNHRIFFAAIQSDFGRSVLSGFGVSEEERTRLDTVFFLQEKTLSRRSSAVFHLFSYLPMPWKWLSYLKLLPSWFMDPAYRLVSRIRYSVFGKLDQCRLPDDSEKSRFLGRKARTRNERQDCVPFMKIKRKRNLILEGGCGHLPIQKKSMTPPLFNRPIHTPMLPWSRNHALDLDYTS